MPNDIKKLRRLMRTANNIRKEKPVILRGATPTQGQALKYAWWFENFRDKLRAGVWRFSFFKLDGSIREARGTLSPLLIPVDKLPSSGASLDKEKSASSFPYFDLDKQGWRSFRLDNFIGFVSPAS